jgi:serine/threonine protein kinase
VLKSEEIIDLKLGMRLLVGSAKGLVTLHSWEPPIFHRDIKTLNILVTSDNLAKISDFGTSVFSQGASSANQGVVGSLPWCAPEVLSQGHFTDKSDIYSFGIVMCAYVFIDPLLPVSETGVAQFYSWEVLNRALTGKYQVPYAGSKFNTDSEFIVQHSGGLRPTIPEGIPENLRGLLQSCWSQDPNDRPSATEVLTALSKIQTSLA